MGPQVKVQWTSFNAGPSAIEALFAGAIDMTYVGPNPAINGYVRSNGEALRVVAGAASGGASLIVRNDAGINSPEDFHGKRVASPQFGNTQDVALRNWLKKHGMKTNDKGGDVQIVPMANPDQLTLFLKKDLDAAWAPEPWATRLIHEGNGRLFVDERTCGPTANSSSDCWSSIQSFCNAHPDLVKNWIRANVDLTDWINAHPAEAKKLLNQQIQRETGKALPAAVLDEAFSRLQVTYDPLHTRAEHRRPAGIRRWISRPQMPDLSRLYDLTLLNKFSRRKSERRFNEYQHKLFRATFQFLLNLASRPRHAVGSGLRRSSRQSTERSAWHPQGRPQRNLPELSHAKRRAAASARPHQSCKCARENFSASSAPQVAASPRCCI